MSTWKVPYRNIRTAQFFSNKMMAPWLPEVFEIEELITQTLEDDKVVRLSKPILQTTYDWQDEALYRAIGDHELTNLISARTRHYQKPFDMRPCIREILRPILREEKEFYLENGEFTDRSYKLKSVNIVREALELAPLPRLEANRKKGGVLSMIFSSPID